MSNTEETVIPFETVRIPNGDKPEGFEEVISDGIDGKRTVTKSEDGQILSDRTKHPKNEVISFGTKSEGEQTDSLSAGDADDATAGNSTETVTTPDSDEDNSPKADGDVKEPLPLPKTEDSNQAQGQLKEKGAKSMNTSALKKAALEAARLLVFAIPGILITVLTSNPELGGSLGATLLLVLKSIDRGIHEDKSNDVKGLLPF